MAIAQATINDTDTILLEVASSKTYAITNIIVCNTYSPNDPSPELHSASFDLHIIKAVSAGNPDTPDNRVTCIVRELTLPAGETFTFDSERIVLEDSDRVTLVAQEPGHDYGDGTTDLAATISYLEV
jgi:hypothetical protein